MANLFRCGSNQNSNLTGEIDVLFNDNGYQFGNFTKNYTLSKKGRVIIIVNGMPIDDSLIVYITIKVNDVIVLSTNKNSHINGIYKYDCNANDVVNINVGTNSPYTSSKCNIIIGQY